MNDKVRTTEQAYLLAQARGQALVARQALCEAAINVKAALGNNDAPLAKQFLAALHVTDEAWTACSEAFDLSEAS